MLKNRVSTLVTAISFSLVSVSVGANEDHGTHKKNHSHAKHGSHAAHEHGAAALNIVVEGKRITLVFEAPAESIYGFEHEAVNDV